MSSRFLLILLLINQPVWGQFSSTAARIVKGAGLPNSGLCASAADVGKVYYRSDTAAGASSMYGCSKTGASSYSWELAGGGGSFSGTPNQIVATDPSGSSTSAAALRPLVSADLPVISYSTLSGVPTLYNQTIQKDGSSQTQRPTLNIKAGSGMTITPNDTGSVTELTFASSGGGGAPAGSNGDFQCNSSGSFGACNINQGTNGDMTPSKAIRYAPIDTCTLVSTTVTCHMATSNIHTFTLTANETLALSDDLVGDWWLIVTQDGTGQWVLTLPASFLNPISPTPGAGTKTIFHCMADGSHEFCVPASTTATAGIQYAPERVAPTTTGVPGVFQGACWFDSGNHTLQCYDNNTTTLYTAVKTDAGATANQWIDSIPVTGIPHKSQPAFSDISGTNAVSQGGTGISTTTAYGVLTAGTTATGNFQQVSGTGTSGQTLTSNGPSTLPTWQTLTGPVISGTGNAVVLPFGRAAYNLAGSTVALRDVYCWQFSPAPSIVAVTVAWKNGALATGAAKWGIFPDSSGAPDFPNGFATSAATLTTNGVFFSALSSSYTLNSGTSYWMCTTGDTVAYNWFASGSTDTDILAQTSHLRSIKCANASTGSGSSIAFPSSCGAQNTGSSGLPYVAILP